MYNFDHTPTHKEGTPTKKEGMPPKTKRAKMVGIWGKYTFRITHIAAAVHIEHSKLLNFPYDHPYILALATT